jgi:hypothetical protein
MKVSMKATPRVVTLQQMIMSGCFKFVLTVEEDPEEIYVVISGSTGGRISIHHGDKHVWPAIALAVPCVNIKTGKLKLFPVSKEVFPIHRVKLDCEMMIT